MNNKNDIKRRCLIVFSMVACIMLYASGYLFNWQILMGDDLKTNVTDQSLKTTSLSTNRGTIYDTTGEKILAQSATVWSVALDPHAISEKDAPIIADELSRILDIDRDYIYEQTQNKNSYFIYIIRKIEDPVRQEILQAIEDNDIGGGIIFENEYKRYYPYATTASQLIGFVGTDNNGLYGLELQYDDLLSGTTGKMISLKDGVGGDMPYPYEELIDAQDGYDLVLTIDETVQSIVEKHLYAGSVQYGVVEGATAIVMDVNTGAIIAMASDTEYDLNDPFTIENEMTKIKISELPQEEQSEAYSKALYSQWKNGAVSNTYYPGSVFKMVTVGAALDSGVITENTTFTCEGKYDAYHNDWINCWSYPYAHGVETARQGICNSCNPFMMQVGEAMGVNLFYSYFEAFGFTSKTQIDLPGEATGIYFTPSNMGPVELATTSFGQNFAITPIQMITAASAIANGGYLVQPHVLQQVLDKDGNIIQSEDTSYVRQVISSEVSAMVSDYLWENATTGTGKTGYVAGYNVAGKTGTSEKINDWVSEGVKTYTVSYCGFAPANDPQYALIVIYDEPTSGGASGGSMAGPTFSQIMAEILPYLGVETTLSTDEYKTEITTTPSVTGLTYEQAKTKFAQAGLTYTSYGDLEDSDIIRMQVPAAGEMVPSSGKVIVSKETSYADNDLINVPDFKGQSVANCRQLASNSGLQLVLTGPTLSGNVVGQTQSINAGSKVKPGSVIQVSIVDFSGLETN